jgi:UDP-2,4-diacetamido-2,4,6-trideoxy-beta-L-altropyranose hydrolase
MNRKLNVYILTEGGNNIGFGHISRCSSLCQAFEDKGHSTMLLIKSEEKLPSEIIKAKFLQIDWVSKKKETKEIINKCDILIIDSYLSSNDDFISFSKISKINAYIDDSNRLQYPAGIIINGSLGAEKIKYQFNAQNLYLLGAKYSFLRKSFWNLEKKKIKSKIEVLLITLGSANNNDLLNRILNALEYINDISKIIILGKLTKIEKEGINNNKIELHSNLNEIEMKDLLLNIDLAITACGQTTYELCRIGTPFIPIITSQNQEYSIQQFKLNGLIIDPIYSNDNQLEKKVYNQFKFFENIEERKIIIKRMNEKIDGSGTNNITNYLINQISKYDKKSNL